MQGTTTQPEVLSKKKIDLNKHHTRFDRVLIVEDDRDVASLTKHTITQNSDAQCEVVFDSFDAIQHLCEHDYNLIILDQNLPGMSGTQFLSRIDDYLDRDPILGELSRFAIKIPVIVMSGNHLPELQNASYQHFKIIDVIEKKDLTKKLSNFF